MNGIIYCISDSIKGGRTYFDQAVLSAKSAKRLHPDLKIAIFRDEPYLNDSVFDFHLPVFKNSDERDWTLHYMNEWSPTKRITNLKVLCSTRSPFEKTLHLDADTYVIQTIYEIFDMLDDFDIMFTNEDLPKLNDGGRNIGSRILTIPDGVNSGVYAFSNTPAAKRILGKQWIEAIEELEIGEQTVLTRFVRDPQKYLYDAKWKMLDNIIYNAQRRMWRSMKKYGLWEEAKILHFASPVNFNKLYEGKISLNDLFELDEVKECDPAYLIEKPREPNKQQTGHRKGNSMRGACD